MEFAKTNLITNETQEQIAKIGNTLRWIILGYKEDKVDIIDKGQEIEFRKLVKGNSRDETTYMLITYFWVPTLDKECLFLFFWYSISIDLQKRCGKKVKNYESMQAMLSVHTQILKNHIKKIDAVYEIKQQQIEYSNFIQSFIEEETSIIIEDNVFEVLEDAKFHDKYRWMIFNFENSTKEIDNNDIYEKELITVNTCGESSSQIQSLQDQISLTNCHIIYLVWTHKIKVQMREIVPHVLIFWIPAAASKEDIQLFNDAIDQIDFKKIFGVKFSVTLSEVFHLTWENISAELFSDSNIHLGEETQETQEIEENSNDPLDESPISLKRTIAHPSTNNKEIPNENSINSSNSEDEDSLRTSKRKRKKREPTKLGTFPVSKRKKGKSKSNEESEVISTPLSSKSHKSTSRKSKNNNSNHNSIRSSNHISNHKTPTKISPKLKMRSPKDIAVALDDGEYGIANVMEVDEEKDIVHVKWYGEIRDQPNHYVLLNWPDEIQSGTILDAQVRFIDVPRKGLLLLEDQSIFDIKKEINE